MEQRRRAKVLAKGENQSQCREGANGVRVPSMSKNADLWAGFRPHIKGRIKFLVSDKYLGKQDAGVKRQAMVCNSH